MDLPNFPGSTPISRRGFIRAAGAMGALAGAESLLPSYAWARPAPNLPGELYPRMENGLAVYDLDIAETVIEIAGRRTRAVTMNGTVPGPLLHLYEGQEVLIRARNRLREDSSIHWHGLIVPPAMDGVPGVSFPGIMAGGMYEYRFPIKQYGTYWYHSHSGLQEQLGHYGPMLVHPRGGTYPYEFDREYVIVLGDWTFDNPYHVLDRLKKQGNYYNLQRRTVGDFLQDASRNGLMATIRERMTWTRMRMDPTDILDVTGATYTYLMNGRAPGSNWTGLFKPGERVLLHVINAAADTYFDVRIPGLPMTVVQASGQYVKPVETDEFRIAIAETYDVIVEPGDQPYTIFAETTDRSGYARGTLTPREGWNAPVPPRRKRPVLSMMDMGMSMSGMEGMGGGDSMQGMDGGSGGRQGEGAAAGSMPGMEMGVQNGGGSMPGMPGMGSTPAAPASPEAVRWAEAGASRTDGLRAPGTLPNAVPHEPGGHGPANSAVPMQVGPRLAEPGNGLGDDGWRVLLYTDLVAAEARADFSAPTREIELHLTGNMDRFMWSINGKTLAESEPIRVNYGERIRLTMVNDTMMNHPMHLHGMWMELENGRGSMIPRVHTVNVKPAERLSLLFHADAPGRWAFHCHILYHMEVGMFRVFEVSEPGKPFNIDPHAKIT